MLIQGQEQVLARRLGEEAVEVAGELTLLVKILITEVFELGIGGPLDHVLNIVAEVGGVLTAVNLLFFDPLSPGRLHRRVVIFVEALSAGNHAIIVVADFIRLGCSPLHPGMAPRLHQRHAFLGVSVRESHDQVEEMLIGFDATVLHGFDGIAVQPAVVGVVGG